MMNIKTPSILRSLAIVAAIALSAAPYARASFPALTLSSSGSMVQAIVSNADPNAPVLFFYPSGGSSSVNIGNTDANGYLTTQINPASYSISVGNPVYVRVNDGQSPTATWPQVSSGSSGSGSTLYLTQTAATVTIGQNVGITASNVSGDLSIPGNTNPSVASASLNGNVITINGLSTGTAAITICSSGSGCATVNVTVQPSYLSSPGVYINPNSLNINAGQNQTASITGYASGPYYVQSNTGSNYVSAAINNSNLVVTGLAAGTSNITVCATGGQCGTMFVNVSSNGSSPTSSNTIPSLSSVNISSSAAGNAFVGAGTIVTISFSANQAITSPQVRVNGSSIIANGSGSGPYTSSYTVTGSESMPIPVAISFANSSGYTGQAYLWLGNSSAGPSTAVSASTAASCPSGLTCTPNSSSSAGASPQAATASSGSYSFTRYLYMGMTKLNVADVDVTALQQRLKADGIYSGPVTGYFGSQTKAAVETYQKKHGLTPLGVIGPGTRDLLNKGI